MAHSLDEALFPPRGPAGPKADAMVPATQDAMRAHLTLARPQTGYEALRVLRAAFPQIPLAERVKAISRFSFVP